MKNIIKVLREHSEWLLAVAGIFLAGWGMKWIIWPLDATAAFFGLGVLQIPFLAISFTLITFGFAWIWTYFRSKSRYNFGDKLFGSTFKELTSWQKHLVFFFWFALFVLTTGIFAISLIQVLVSG